MNISDPGILKVLSTNATGTGGALIQSARPLLGVRADMSVSTPAAVLGVINFVAGADGTVSPLVAISGDDGQDSVAPVVPDVMPFTISRLTVYDPASNTWMRAVSAPTDADGIVYDTVGRVLQVASTTLLNDGASLSRLQSASVGNLISRLTQGAALVMSPGEWSVEARPAAAAVATATRAAGGLGIRNVCRSITASLIATAAQAQVDVVVRDGAAGAGAILWSARFAGLAGTSDRVVLSGLNIIGSDNTAMTIEFLAAPAATNFQGVAMTGCLAS